MERTAEFDAFGPWILAVTSVDDVPRAFRSYPFRFGGEMTIVKVPKDIARRDANPAMHLYDRILIVTHSEFVALDRVDDSFHERTVAIADIAIVECGSELLDGWLVVTSVTGETTRLEYNGSSRPVIQNLVDLLVAGATDGKRTTGVSDSMDLDALGAEDTALVNLFRAASRRRPLAIVATHRGQLSRRPRTFLERVKGVRPLLSGLVLCENPSELVLLCRRDWEHTSPKRDLSTREIVVLKRHVSLIESSPKAEAEPSAILRISAGESHIEAIIPSDASPLARQSVTPLLRPAGYHPRPIEIGTASR